MNDAEHQQKEPLDALLSWSRWLIGVGVVAVGGCLAFVKPEMAEEQHAHIKLAITYFGCSVIVAAVLGLVVVASKHRDSLACCRIAWFLAFTQLALLVFGTYEFRSWLDNLPVQAKSDATTSALERAEGAADRAEAAANRAEATRDHIIEVLRDGLSE